MSPRAWEFYRRPETTRSWRRTSVIWTTATRIPLPKRDSSLRHLVLLLLVRRKSENRPENEPTLFRTAPKPRTVRGPRYVSASAESDSFEHDFSPAGQRVPSAEQLHPVESTPKTTRANRAAIRHSESKRIFRRSRFVTRDQHRAHRFSWKQFFPRIGRKKTVPPSKSRRFEGKNARVRLLRTHRGLGGIGWKKKKIENTG